MTQFESGPALGYEMDAVVHDPFIDDLSRKPVTSSAEVPHLKELAEKAIPAVSAKAIGMHVLHATTTSSSEGTRPHAA
jgi:hypothetical protein